LLTLTTLAPWPRVNASAMNGCSKGAPRAHPAAHEAADSRHLDRRHPGEAPEDNAHELLDVVKARGRAEGFAAVRPDKLSDQ
jgi:hypothetical protein